MPWTNSAPASMKRSSSRLDADVRIGGFLSGGLDSAAVLESVARQYDQKIETFTIRFSDDAGDEANAAAEAARQLGIENTAIRVTGDQLVDEFTRSVWHAEIPVINSTGTAKMLLGVAARDHLKAVMTGSGADELFGGYGMYQHQMLIEEARAGKDVAAEMQALRRNEDVVASLLPVKGYRRHGQVTGMFGAYPYQAIRPFVFGSIVSRMLHPTTPAVSIRSPPWVRSRDGCPKADLRAWAHKAPAST